MKKIKIKRNGFILWYRERYKGHKVAYAMQYEPTNGLTDDNDPTTAQVYIGFDGSEPEDLIKVLEERDKMRKTIEDIELKKNDEEFNEREALTKRVCSLENKIYTLENKIYTQKKWYQFWK